MIPQELKLLMIELTKIVPWKFTLLNHDSYIIDEAMIVHPRKIAFKAMHTIKQPSKEVTGFMSVIVDYYPAGGGADQRIYIRTVNTEKEMSNKIWDFCMSWTMHRNITVENQRQ